MTQKPEQALATLQSSQESLLRWLDSPQVTNPEEQRNAENLLISARYALRQAEEKRKEITRPLDESKARIMALFKPYLTRLQTGIDTVNGELTRYRLELLALQQEQQRRAMEEAAARAAEAQETGEITEPVDALDVPNVTRTSRADLGTVTYREDWDVQIVDPLRVPRDLCEPSLPRIRARVKSGVTSIPGVLITRKTVSVARTAGARKEVQHNAKQW